MEQEWYYYGNDRNNGPYSEAQLQRFFADGLIDEETHVWRPGLPDWVTYGIASQAFTHHIASEAPSAAAAPPAGGVAGPEAGNASLRLAAAASPAADAVPPAAAAPPPVLGHGGALGQAYGSSGSAFNEVDEDLAAIIEDESRRFRRALVAGFTGMTLGAGIWALVAYLTGYNIGLLAILNGAIVGVLIQFAGQSKDIKFGIIGAVYAGLSVYLGNFLTLLVFFAYGSASAGVEEMGWSAALSPAGLAAAFIYGFIGSGLLGILFYALAILEGFKFSRFGSNSS